MSTLVLVPCTYGVPELDVFDGLKVVALDEMLMAGFAGVYFRRLFVQSVIDPVKRMWYESKRHEYLIRALREKQFADGTVFVGTRASDVDLMDFQFVYSVRVSDRGLRAMSRVVYGDPILMYMEFLGLLRAVDLAVDEQFTIVEWSELPLLIVRKFQNRVEADATIHSTRQRAILSEVLSGDNDAQVWLEDVVYRSGTEKRTMFLADYDYLSFIRPVWRDAVVRLFGKAPSVSDVFRLPWCVVDSGTLSSLCYRPNVAGRPTASARGHSLIQFVHTRLAGSLTTREMIGTWVGGLLCDDLTAVDTIMSLGDQVLAPAKRMSIATFSRTDAARVPVEYAWMYEAVRDVSFCEWDGDRTLDGMPDVPHYTTCEGWIESLSLAALYSHVPSDSVMATCVVQFLSRLHAINLVPVAYARLNAYACQVFEEGCTRDNFDEVLAPMLPGYNYLAAVAPYKRLHALQLLGCCPGLAAVVAYTSFQITADGAFSVEEVCADVARLMLYSGKALSSADRVGHAIAGQSEFTDEELEPDTGYCYDCMFKPEYKAKARSILRAFPTFQRLMHWRMIPWYIENALDVVCVSQGLFIQEDGKLETVLHLAVDGDGVPLRCYLRAVGSLKVNTVDVRRMRVGQTGVCHSGSWFVSAIISWTIVGCALFGILVWLLYKRCISGSAGGGSSRRRFY